MRFSAAEFAKGPAEGLTPAELIVSCSAKMMCLNVCGDVIRKRTVVFGAGRVGRFLCSRNLPNNESRAISFWRTAGWRDTDL